MHIAPNSSAQSCCAHPFVPPSTQGHVPRGLLDVRHGPTRGAENTVTPTSTATPSPFFLFERVDARTRSCASGASFDDTHNNTNTPQLHPWSCPQPTPRSTVIAPPTPTLPHARPHPHTHTHRHPQPYPHTHAQSYDHQPHPEPQSSPHLHTCTTCIQEGMQARMLTLSSAAARLRRPRAHRSSAAVGAQPLLRPTC